MILRVLPAVIAALLVAMSGVSHAITITASGGVASTNDASAVLQTGANGLTTVGVFATSDEDVTLLGYNIPTLISDPSVASFVSFEATDFGFGTESSNALSNPPFIGNFGLAGAAHSGLSILAGQTVQIGSITFDVVNAPVGVTSIAEFIASGFDVNFFQFTTSEFGSVTGLSGDAVPGAGAAIQVVPSPSSLLGLASLGLFGSIVRRRRR